ncbi:hypothetical protein VitviT2T_000583 [Vitis vinifera]|uniref:Transmembrane protein n=3 Tax=Vitis TaxID=3603 RepID=A0ABY9BCW2_VITVI|nr:uncharacterized protein LOC100254296 [Vitis vinifera]WJZ80683.1 hypothetical protein VitviT2T_000583 [Vitis vinifera]|eukprot:XP_002285399.2 PREDICTED: uncharacterized protein LOC100254296 [Vitis vinifera]
MTSAPVSVSPFPRTVCRRGREVRTSMVRLVTAFGMTVAAFMFWETMDKVHVWIALRQDAKKERIENEMAIKRRREQLIEEAKQKGMLP